MVFWKVVHAPLLKEVQRDSEAFLKLSLFREGDSIYVYQSSRPDAGGSAIYDHYTQTFGIWRFQRVGKDLQVDFISQIDFREGDKTEKAQAAFQKEWLQERHTKFHAALQQHIK